MGEATPEERDKLSQEQKEEALKLGCYGLVAKWRGMNVATNKRGRTDSGQVLGGSHAAGPSQLRGVCRSGTCSTTCVSAIMHNRTKYGLGTHALGEVGEAQAGRHYDMALRALNPT